MKIIFLTLFKIRNEGQKDIYSSLLREFTSHGHDVYVISPVERREKERFNPIDIGKLHLHFVDIGNCFNTSPIEKGLTTLLIGMQFKRLVQKELSDVSFDMILYSTPPITFANTIKYLKKNHKAMSYFMLRDVRPQSLADLGSIKKSGWQGIIYRQFRMQEMYKISDYIGCMFPASAKYLLQHNKGVDRKKVEICPNAINKQDVIQRPSLSETDRLVGSCDVGMIVLDHRFTTPNYLSRLFSYLSEKKPVILTTENISDVGTVAQKNGYDYWCKSTDARKFAALMDEYIDLDKKREMGERGYRYMKEKYSTEVAYHTIMRHF